MASPGSGRVTGRAPDAPLPWSGGRRLEGRDRSHAERRTGEPLAGLTVHEGPGTDAALAAMGTRAASAGDHIWLAAGEADRPRRVAHEAAHVLQHRRGRAGLASGGVAALEREADEASHGRARVRHGGPVASGGLAILRDGEDQFRLSAGIPQLSFLRVALARENGREERSPARYDGGVGGACVVGVVDRLCGWDVEGALCAPTPPAGRRFGRRQAIDPSGGG